MHNFSVKVLLLLTFGVYIIGKIYYMYTKFHWKKMCKLRITWIWTIVGQHSKKSKTLLENYDQINKQSTNLCWLKHNNDQLHWFCNFWKNQQINI